MPDYLIIDTSDGRKLESGGKVITDVDDEKEALAILISKEGYRYAAQYVIFNVNKGVHINTEQERSVALLDAKDETGTRVLAKYDEAQLEALKESRRG